MAKRAKLEAFDGLGPKEKKRINQVVSEVWYQSRARNTAKRRCMDKQGFTRCEKCGKRTPSIKIDHITPRGPVDSVGYIERTFCPSSELQCLCHPCHKPKTKQESQARAILRDMAKIQNDYRGVRLDTPAARKKKPSFTDTF